jgi:hypothetical protein
VSTPAAEGYKNDTICQHCGQPMIGTLRGWCADCCGEPLAERTSVDDLIERTSVVTRSRELARARVTLRAYSQVMLAALTRLERYAQEPCWAEAADLAALWAWQDARVCARAAMVLRPDLRPERAA